MITHKKLFFIPLFIAAFSSCSAISNIKTIAEMAHFLTFINYFEPNHKQMPSKCTEDVPLVLLDLDGTLLVPQEDCLRPCNDIKFNQILSKVKDLYKDTRQLTEIKGEIIRQTGYSLTDQLIPDVIQRIKALKYNSMILTARNMLGCFLSNFMSQPGINEDAFSPLNSKLAIKRFNAHAKTSLNKNNSIAYIDKNIIFCNFNPKGKCLLTLLESYKLFTNKIPTTIIFIDDDISNLEAVQEAIERFACTNLVEIDFYGFYYTGAKKAPIDETLTYFQVEYFFQTKVWLTAHKAITKILTDYTASRLFADNQAV